MNLNTGNPADHKDHNPARCDFARIWLTQQFVAGTHAEHVAALTDDQLGTIGKTSEMYSMLEQVEPIYAEYNLTLDNLKAFADYLRNYLLNERGYANRLKLTMLDSTRKGDPSLN